MAVNVARFPAGTAGGPAGPEPRIGDVMRSAGNVVAPDTPAAAAATLLAVTGCSGVAVVNHQRAVVGLVTEADLVRDRLAGVRRADGPAPAATVAEVMSSDPLLAPSGYDLGALVGLMLAVGTPVVPIVDNGQLVGMVDMRDLVRVVGGSRTDLPAAQRA